MIVRIGTSPKGMIFVATISDKQVLRSMNRLIHRSAWNKYSANFAKNSSQIHRGSLGYRWGGSQPSLSSSFSFPELLVGYPVTHPLLSLFTRVPRK